MYKWWKIDVALFALIILGMMFFRQDIVLASGIIILLPVLIWTKRTVSLKYLALSAGIAIIWAIIAGDLYNYGRGFITIGNVNSFAILEWTIGLFGIQHFFRQINIKRFWNKMLIFTIIYWITLIIVEILAYHVFGFRDLATSQYPGLPICNCIHAPVFMQIVYLFLGPAYYALTLLLDKIYKKR